MSKQKINSLKEVKISDNIVERLSKFSNQSNLKCQELGNTDKK